MNRLARYALAAAAAFAPTTLAAQQPRAWPRWYLGGAIEYGRALEDAAEHVRDGAGLSAFGAWRLGPRSPFALRMNGHVLIYGTETDTYPIGPGVNVDITTTNTIAGFALGPQYIAGGPHLEAYVYGMVGGSYIATTTSQGDGGDESTALDDWAWAGEAGGGLLIHLSRVLALDAGARYRYVGEVTYLPRGGLQLVGGSWVNNAVTTDVPLVLYHVGLTVKLGGIRPKETPPESEF